MHDRLHMLAIVSFTTLLLVGCDAQNGLAPKTRSTQADVSKETIVRLHSQNDVIGESETPGQLADDVTDRLVEEDLRERLDDENLEEMPLENEPPESPR